MATEISICSNALLRLGADPISSFDEADVSGSNIDRARLCANLWPTVRQQVLRSGSWNVATKRVLLSPDAAPPDFGFSYRFLRPGDWLRTISLGERYTRGMQYRSEGAYILCDEASLQMVYVFDNTNPATYDASLVGVMELAMQVVLAYPVTKSTSLRDGLAQELKEVLAQSRGIDAQDDPQETLGDFPLYQARMGAGFRGAR